MKENKFTPFLEWKFYSNLIKTHPCHFFPLQGDTFHFYLILQWEAKDPGQSGPQLQAGSRVAERFSGDVHCVRLQCREGGGSRACLS